MPSLRWLLHLPPKRIRLYTISILTKTWFVLFYPSWCICCECICFARRLRCPFLPPNLTDNHQSKGSSWVVGIGARPRWTDRVVNYCLISEWKRSKDVVSLSGVFLVYFFFESWTHVICFDMQIPYPSSSTKMVMIITCARFIRALCFSFLRFFYFLVTCVDIYS